MGSWDKVEEGVSIGLVWVAFGLALYTYSCVGLRDTFIIDALVSTVGIVLAHCEYTRSAGAVATLAVLLLLYGMFATLSGSLGC